MHITNYEFKARAGDLQVLEKKLGTLNPVFAGEDYQVDTYFKVTKGRLKLREGRIENALIYYERRDTAGTKQSDVLLYKHRQDSSLKDILARIHGIRIVVEKTRRIYFIDNVKFHFDTVRELGTFIEVEAIDNTGIIGIKKLKEQCERYFEFFGFKSSELIGKSYSDLFTGKGARAH